MQTIDFDLPCARCGYNLRTLPRDGACPECAASVSATLELARRRVLPLSGLRSEGAAWMIDVRRGLTLAIVANAAAFVGAFYPWSEPYYQKPGWGGVLWLAPLTCVFVLSCWAAWRLAACARPHVVSIIGRSAAACVPLSLALLFINGRWHRYYFDLNHETYAWLDAQSIYVASVLGRWLLIAWPVAVVVTFGQTVRLLWLARSRATAITAATFALPAAAYFLLIVGTALTHDVDTSRAGSGELMMITPGPTGTLPIAPLVVRDVIANLSFMRGNVLPFAMLALAVGFLFASLAVPCWLRAILTRAIRLGELPAASSRS